MIGAIQTDFFSQIVTPKSPREAKSVRPIRCLNLYGGVGGNRKLWKNVKVTMVEKTPAIAEVYQEQNPEDEVVIADAHEYLLEHFHKYDFIWSSPPCQGNTRMIRGGRNRSPRYPDLRLYEEVLFLKHNFKGAFVVENVIPYYEPLIPGQKVGRHIFWSNFRINEDVELPKFQDIMHQQNLHSKKLIQDWLGIHFERTIYYEGNHCPTQVLRNCVHPILGKHVFECFLEYYTPGGS